MRCQNPEIPESKNRGKKRGSRYKLSDLRKFPRTKEYLLEWKGPVYLAQWVIMDRAKSKC